MLGDAVFRLTYKLLKRATLTSDAALAATTEAEAGAEATRRSVPLLHVLVREHGARATLLLQVLGSVCIQP